MPLQLKFKTIVRRNLFEILRYIADRNGDWETAEKFGERLVARCQRLTVAPGSGVAYLPRRGCRKIVEGAYKIIYCEEAGTLDSSHLGRAARQ